MKFLLKTVLVLLLCTNSYAQTGIGTVTPQDSAILDLNATAKTLLLPRIADTSMIAEPEDGMMVYDISSSCVKIFQNAYWSACIYNKPGTIASIDSANAINSGTLREGVTSFGVYSSIPYVGATSGYHFGQSVTGTGVGGLTATLNATSINNTGNLIYNISGTPTSYGFVSFAINVGGQSTTITLEVMPAAPIVATLNCTGATHTGTLTRSTAAVSVTSVISYTGGNTGEYPVQTVESTGVAGLTATIAAGRLAAGNGNITIAITGNPSSNGIAEFAIVVGGKSCTLQRTVNPLIGTVTAIDCAGASHTGALTNNITAVAVSSVIEYSGGNTGDYTAQTFSSTGVSGLTATIAAGSFAGGNGSITISITGTPTATGNAAFSINLGGKTCTLVRNVEPQAGIIASLNCAAATSAGTLQYGSAVSGGSFTIAYTGGNGGVYASQTLASTGVTGLTATLNAGTFAVGTGQLVYSLTGTPYTAGAANFNITIGGQNCTVVVTIKIKPASIPANITIKSSQKYLLPSVYDTDYIPYTTPSAAATTAPYAANGVADPVINIPGVITTSGKSITLVVNATGSGTLPSYQTGPITIPANLTEDGISMDVVLYWQTQAYTAATKTIIAQIRAVGGTLNVKKLDINTGVGNDALGVLLGTVLYPVNASNSSSTFAFRAVSAIPDKKFGIADNSGSISNHRFIYFPTIGEEGNVWLTNNLGADYTNMNKAGYNPVLQASSANDYYAHGNLFQWGRDSDGHELINRTGIYTATPVYGYTTTKSNFPTTALLILNGAAPKDWRITQSSTLWSGVSASNNPCPQGFRVPSYGELSNYVSSASITNSATAVSSILKLPLAGWYRNDAVIDQQTVSGYYWTSTPYNTYAYALYFNTGGAVIGPSYTYPRVEGFSVRCIK